MMFFTSFETTPVESCVFYKNADPLEKELLFGIPMAAIAGKEMMKTICRADRKRFSSK